MTFLQTAINTVASVQAELTIFCVAIVMHFLMFSRYRIKGKEPAVGGAKKPKGATCSSNKLGMDPSHTPSHFPGISDLVRQVKTLLREHKSQEEIVFFLKGELQEKSKEDVFAALEALLENLGKAATTSLLSAVHAVLQAHDLTPNGRLGEGLLRGFLHFRQAEEFDQVLAEVEKEGLVTPLVTSLAMRAAIQASDFEVALRRLPAFSAICPKQLGNDSACAVPQQLMKQLVRLAAQRDSMARLLKELCDLGLFLPWVVELVLSDCAERACQCPEAAEAFDKTLQLAQAREVEFTAGARAALLRRSNSTVETRKLLAEAGTASPEVLLVAAEMAETHEDAGLADDVLQLMEGMKPPVELAATAIRLCAAKADADSAILKLFERMDGVDIMADASAGHLVASAALRVGRRDLLQRLLAINHEGPKQVALLKSIGAKQGLQAAEEIFKAFPEKPTFLYNALLDISIECGDVSNAERIQKEAAEFGLGDVITYNTMIKAHIQAGNVTKARTVIETMRTEGITPNVVTFNELLDETVIHSRSGAWDLIQEMQACGVQPNPTTCSILLKSIQKSTRPVDIEETFALVKSVEWGMDEVLLSSLCEACIRAGWPNLLKRSLRLYRGPGGVNVQGSHTYGSIIRAYGMLKDLRGVWDTWKEMRSRHILPTSITLGCMVEALVNNDGPDAGYQLISEALEDEKMRPLLNSVIYCSVLKGFRHQKRFDRVWDLHQEMVRDKIELSITIYNTLIDACARNCEMTRVPKLLEEMTTLHIEPNIITYSTILKGYCQERRLEQAFDLLEVMKRTKFMPDEVTYNTLLDGCARHGLYDKGIGLLNDMQTAGVRPSDYTLSILVKLANRGDKLDQGLELCHEISKKYNFAFNIHVYNNIMQAYTQNYNLPDALRIFRQLLREEIRPGLRSYNILLHACIGAGEAQTAADLLRAAAGLEQRHPMLSGFATAAMRPSDDLTGELVCDIIREIAGRCQNEGLALQVLQELKRSRWIRLDSKLTFKLACRVNQVPSRK